MRKILILLFFLLCAKASFAQNLCDASCNLTITFPDGGTITAVETLTFTFGAGGVLDLGATGTINSAVPPVSTDFSAGGTLSLATGESITFDVNGSLDLGAGGNIDYTNMTIVTTGDITIDAVGGAGTVTIPSMTLSGDLTITSADTITVENNGTLNLESGTIILDGDLDVSGGSITSTTGSLTVSATGTLTLDGGVIITDASLSSLEVNNIAVVNTGNLVINDGAVIDLNSGIINSTTLIQEDLVNFEGFTFNTADGNTCTVENGECVTATGAKYIIVDGELVLAGDGGSVDIYLLLALFIMLLIARNQSVFCMRKC